MTTGPDLDAPTLGEIARVVYAIQQDVRGFRTEHVRSDVYTVAHTALKDRITDLEREIAAAAAARQADRRLVAGSLLAAALSLVVQFVQSR